MSAETELFERIATLEARLEAAEKQHVASQAQFALEREAQNRAINELLQKFARYEGKWGGIVMVVSAIGAMLALFKAEIVRRWFGG